MTIIMTIIMTMLIASTAVENGPVVLEKPRLFKLVAQPEIGALHV